MRAQVFTLGLLLCAGSVAGCVIDWGPSRIGAEVDRPSQPGDEQPDPVEPPVCDDSVVGGTLVAEFEHGIWRMEATTDRLYFVEPNQDRVGYVSKDGADLVVFDDQPFPWSFAADDAGFFYVRNDTELMTVVGGQPLVFAESNGQYISSVALDADYVYWLDFTEGLVRSARDGTGNEPVAAVAEGSYLAVDDQWAYFTTQEDGGDFIAIWRVDKTGGMPELLAVTDFHHADAITELVPYGDRLYFVEQGGGSGQGYFPNGADQSVCSFKGNSAIVSIPKDGGELTREVEGVGAVWAFDVDDAGITFIGTGLAARQCGCTDATNVLDDIMFATHGGGTLRTLAEHVSGPALSVDSGEVHFATWVDGDEQSAVYRVETEILE